MEMRALRDLLGVCGPEGAAAVRARLEEVTGRMVASPAELDSTLGSV